MSETPLKHAMMRDMVMSWDEISNELIWDAYDMNGPEHQDIAADRLEEFCKRFPHFEERLRSYVNDWNKDPKITQEMLAAIDCEEISQDEIDKNWRQAKRILDFYRKLREVEAQRDKAQAALSAAEQRAEAMRFALAGLLADIEDYQTINKLGGENNHWQVIARNALSSSAGNPTEHGR